MKKLFILLFAVIALFATGRTQVYVDTADYVSITRTILDSLGNDGYLPDSVRIIITKNGNACADSAWYNSGDAEATAYARSLTWFAKFAAIDADSGNGIYHIEAYFYNATYGLGALAQQDYHLIAGRTLKYATDSVFAALDVLQARESWTLAGRQAIGDTIQREASTLTTGSSIASVSGAVGSVTGAVGSVTGNIGGNVVGSVASVTGAVGSVTGNVGGSVASVTGAVGSVTGNVGGNVVGSVASVTGAVGSVTGNVGGNVTGSVGSVVAAVPVDFDNITGDLDVTELSDSLEYLITIAGDSSLWVDPATTAFTPTDTSEGGGTLSSFNPTTDVVTPTDTSEGGGSIGTSAWNSTQRDSVLNAIADAGKANFKADVSLLALSSELDSVLQAIADANKVNFKADVSGLSTFDPATDAVTPTDTLDGGDSIAVRPTDWSADDSTAYQGAAGSSPWNSTQRDSVLDAIADANKGNFKADVSGVATATDLDSVLNAIADANKGNFKANVSGLSTFDPATDLVTPTDTIANGDSIAVRPTDWSADDSTAYQGAAGSSPWNSTQRDSVLNAIADAGKANFQADVSGLSTFDPATDVVTPTDTLEGGDSIAVRPADWAAEDSTAYGGSGGVASAAAIDAYLSERHGAGSWRGSRLDDVPDSNMTEIEYSILKPNGSAWPYAIVTIDLKAVHDSLLSYGDNTLSNYPIADYVDTASVDGLARFYLIPNDSIIGDSTYYRFIVRDRTGRNIIKSIFNCRIPAADSVIYLQNLTRW
jgi:hypothetical protein